MPPLPGAAESDNTAFVTEMRAAIDRHKAADSDAQRREITREMVEIMRRYLRCDPDGYRPGARRFFPRPGTPTRRTSVDPDRDGKVLALPESDR